MRNRVAATLVAALALYGAGLASADETLPPGPQPTITQPGEAGVGPVDEPSTPEGRGAGGGGPAGPVDAPHTAPSVRDQGLRGDRRPRDRQPATRARLGRHDTEVRGDRAGKVA